MAGRIQSYESDTQASGAQDVPAARNYFAEGAGESIGHLGDVIDNAVDKAQKNAGQKEQSQVANSLSGAQAKFSIDMDETFKKADPNDGTVADNLMQEYDDRMSAIGDKLETPQARSYFNEANAHARAHFLLKSYSMQSQMAGLASEQNYNSSVANWSTQVQNDPSSFDTVVEQHQKMIDSMHESGRIDGNTADAFSGAGETKFAQAQVQGYAKISPPATKKMLEGGQWDNYFDANQKEQMGAFVNKAIEDQAREGRKDAQDKRDGLADQQEAWMNQAFANLYVKGGKGLSINDVNASPLFEKDKEHFKKLIDDKLRGDDANPEAFNNLFNRITAKDGDPSKITTDDAIFDAAHKSLITPADVGKLLPYLNGRKTEAEQNELQQKNEFLKKARDQIVTEENAMSGIKDPNGSERYYRFWNDWNSAYTKGKAGGKTPAQMLSPDSPDYLGGLIKQYVPSYKDVMDSYSKWYAPTQPNPSPSATPIAPAGKAPAATSAALPQTGPRRDVPKVGEVVNGYKFTGGKPSDRNSWEKAR